MKYSQERKQAVLADLAPAGARAELVLFMDCAEPRSAASEVPDPYYGDLSDYEHALDLIEEAMPGLLRRIRQALG